MTPSLTLLELFETFSDKLPLHWVAGKQGAARLLSGDSTSVALHNLVGPMNCIHPNCIQVLGRIELDYLGGLGKNSHMDVVQQLFSRRPSAIIFADGSLPSAEFINRARRSKVPLLTSELPASQVISDLQYYITHLLAKRCTIHGVFMEVLGMGVLLSGESAVGKSELALELITRGHRLIADDVAEFARIAPDILEGSCPPVLRSFLEVRGLGVLNVRAMFGDSAIKERKYLRLIICLRNLSEIPPTDIDRLEGSHSTRNLLGVEIPEVILPVAPGRNLAILIEAAVRNHSLRLKGYEASQDFGARQREFIDQQGQEAPAQASE